jgi:hypothetical protein
LRLARRCAGLPTTVEWQVVVYDGARVRSGERVLAAGESVARFAVPANPRDRTWLLFTYDSEAGQLTNTGQKLVRGHIVNPALVSFERASPGQEIALTYYLVGFEDGTRVQHESTSFPGDADSQVVELDQVAPPRSLVSLGSPLGAAAAPVTDGNWSAGRFSAALTSGRELRLRRWAAGGMTAEVSWSVIELPGGAQADGGAADARPRADGGRPVQDAGDAPDGAGPGSTDAGPLQVVDLSVGCACRAGGRRPSHGAAALPLLVIFAVGALGRRCARARGRRVIHGCHGRAQAAGAHISSARSAQVSRGAQ